MTRRRLIYINTLRLLLLALSVLLVRVLMAQGTGVRITVDQAGRGDFRFIQAAINSLPDSGAVPRIIFIRKGIYREKLYLEKHNIILHGEDRDATIITQDIARDEWRCIHNDDWGAATVNIDGNDIGLMNLTVANEYGFKKKETRVIDCRTDTIHQQKIITATGHQMALRSFRSTRLKALNCRFRSYAGDTVSPWNTGDGMFYFKDCMMEGGVDFYCPRGWAWAENCSFYSNTGVAAIWHDGSGNREQKTVFKNCSFDGFDGFNLGRYHRDAQFFLIGCRFSKNMADRDIYQVPTANHLRWGRRVFYSGCKREGGNYSWFADNLNETSPALTDKDITVDWLFKGLWKPDRI